MYGWSRPLARAAEGIVLEAAGWMLRRIGRAAGGLNAHNLDCGWPLAHDTYNGMGIDANGNIHYVLCSTEHEHGVRNVWSICRG